MKKKISDLPYSQVFWLLYWRLLLLSNWIPSIVMWEYVCVCVCILRETHTHRQRENDLNKIINERENDLKNIIYERENDLNKMINK